MLKVRVKCWEDKREGFSGTGVCGKKRNGPIMSAKNEETERTLLISQGSAAKVQTTESCTAV